MALTQTIPLQTIHYNGIPLVTNSHHASMLDELGFYCQMVAGDTEKSVNDAFALGYMKAPSHNKFYLYMKHEDAVSFIKGYPSWHGTGTPYLKNVEIPAPQSSRYYGSTWKTDAEPEITEDF